MSNHRYPWPASALTKEEMKLLYLAREAHPNHPPITQLIARAVRQLYQPQSTQKEPNHETSLAA